MTEFAAFHRFEWMTRSAREINGIYEALCGDLPEICNVDIFLQWTFGFGDVDTLVTMLLHDFFELSNGESWGYTVTEVPLRSGMEDVIPLAKYLMITSLFLHALGWSKLSYNEVMEKTVTSPLEIRELLMSCFVRTKHYMEIFEKKNWGYYSFGQDQVARSCVFLAVLGGLKTSQPEFRQEIMLKVLQNIKCEAEGEEEDTSFDALCRRYDHFWLRLHEVEENLAERVVYLV